MTMVLDLDLYFVPGNQQLVWLWQPAGSDSSVLPFLALPLMQVPHSQVQIA